MSHLGSIVDFNYASVLFKEYDFVNLLEVVNLLDVTVVIGLVDDFSALVVLHVDLGCIRSIVLYFMFNQI